MIDLSVGEVKAGTQVVLQIGERITALHSSVTESAKLIGEIASAGRQQAVAIDEVNVAVQQMDEITQHNAALVEQTNAAIEQTEAQASELDRIVDVFRISQETTRGRSEPAVPAGARGLQERLATASANLKTHGNAAVAPDWSEF